MLPLTQWTGYFSVCLRLIEWIESCQADCFGLPCAFTFFQKHKFSHLLAGATVSHCTDQSLTRWYHLTLRWQMTWWWHHLTLHTSKKIIFPDRFNVHILWMYIKIVYLWRHFEEFKNLVFQIIVILPTFNALVMKKNWRLQCLIILLCRD